MNILWLTSWYPSRVNFLAGDFIERHAKAASLFDTITVVHVVKDASIRNNKICIEKIEYSDTLTALIYYYPSYKKWGRFADLIISGFYYVGLHFKAYRFYKIKYGKPKGILVQVAIKAGLVAYLWKLIFNIPYIVYERWTGLLKNAKPNISGLHPFYKTLWKVVLRNSLQLVTVSHYFGKSILPLTNKKEYIVIPNMVDHQLFYPLKEKDNTVFHLIHVSTLDYQKNFENILLAMHLVNKKEKNIDLFVYGPVTDNLKEMTAQLGLENIIYYRGEVKHSEIAKAMQQSHALVLYSRYESFGNVITEANACGLPVIVSDLPVFHEIVKEGITGIFVNSKAPEELAEKIIWLKYHYDKFKPQDIHDYIKEKYNSFVIGKMFNSLFTSCFE